MYINLSVLGKSGLEYSDLVFLAAIKQMDKEVIDKLTGDTFNRLEQLSLLTSIKGKKGDNPIYNIRLSEKGKKLMTDLSFEGAVDDESEKIRDWVVSVYKNKNGGIVKNKTELGRRIHWFKTITDIRGNFLAVLIQCVMQDTYDPECGQSFYDAKKDNSRLILSNLAENLFWMPQSHFDRHYTLDKSPLFTYYEDNQDYIKQVWNQLLNEDGSRK
jgi:hypothetical protein